MSPSSDLPRGSTPHSETADSLNRMSDYTLCYNTEAQHQRLLYGTSTSDVLTKYRSGEQTKTTDMDRACSMHGGEERCIQGFGGET